MQDLDEHLSAIVAGDADVFGRWVASAEPVLRESLRSFATVIDAEAVLQEALLRVWQVAPRFVADGKPNGLLRFGIRVARNLAVSERRRVRSEPFDDAALDRALVDTYAPTWGLAADPLLRRVIEECRRKLPDKPLQALLARLANGGAEPDEVLASRLAMRVNTFLQNFTRARRFLAECLKGRGVDLDSEMAR